MLVYKCKTFKLCGLDRIKLYCRQVAVKEVIISLFGIIWYAAFKNITLENILFSDSDNNNPQSLRHRF